MASQTIIDAGPLIAWFNTRDQWHEWSVSTLSARKGPLQTTEIVLGEACWHLGGNTKAVHGLLDLVRPGAIEVARIWPELLADTQRLMLKYPAMDTADASLVTLYEAQRNAEIVTVDRRDFELCRGLRNRPLRVALPPRRR